MIRQRRILYEKIPPNPPLAKGGMEVARPHKKWTAPIPPFHKGGPGGFSAHPMSLVRTRTEVEAARGDARGLFLFSCVYLFL